MVFYCIQALAGGLGIRSPGPRPGMLGGETFLQWTPVMLRYTEASTLAQHLLSARRDPSGYLRVTEINKQGLSSDFGKALAQGKVFQVGQLGGS